MDNECVFLLASSVVAGAYVTYNIMQDDKEEATWTMGPGLPPPRTPTDGKEIKSIQERIRYTGQKALQKANIAFKTYRQDLINLKEGKTVGFRNPMQILELSEDIIAAAQEDFPNGPVRKVIDDLGITERFEKYSEIARRFEKMKQSFVQTPRPTKDKEFATDPRYNQVRMGNVKPKPHSWTTEKDAQNFRESELKKIELMDPEEQEAAMTEFVASQKRDEIIRSSVAQENIIDTITAAEVKAKLKATPAEVTDIELLKIEGRMLKSATDMRNQARGKIPYQNIAEQALLELGQEPDLSQVKIEPDAIIAKMKMERSQQNRDDLKDMKTMGYEEPQRGDNLPSIPEAKMEVPVRSGFETQAETDFGVKSAFEAFGSQDTMSESSSADDLPLNQYGRAIAIKNKTLIDGVNTIKWPGALPPVPRALGGRGARPGIEQDVPATQLLLYVHGYYEKIRTEKDTGQKYGIMTTFQSNFKFDHNGDIYTNFVDFAQLRRFYMLGRRYKNLLVAPQTSGIYLMQETFDFYMAVEQIFANMIGISLSINRPQPLPVFKPIDPD